MASETFTPDLARSLDGPDWLRARRERAAEAASAIDAPTSELEEWRYSRIGDLRLDRYRPVDPSTAPGAVPVPAAALVTSLGELAGVVVVHNGRVVDVQLGDDAVNAGVHFGPATDDTDGVLGASETSRPTCSPRTTTPSPPIRSCCECPAASIVERPFAVVSLRRRRRRR